FLFDENFPDNQIDLQWIKIMEPNQFDYQENFHKIRSIKKNPNSNNIFSGLSIFKKEKFTQMPFSRPGLAKFDQDGNLLSKKFILTDKDIGTISDFEFIDKERFMAISFFERNYNFEEEGQNSKVNIEEFESLNFRKSNTFPPEAAKAVIFDTLGSILKEIQLDMVSISICKTRDNKYLILGNNTLTLEKHPTVVLSKFNQNLEFDTIYSESREYDYKCDHPINDSEIYLLDFLKTGLFEEDNQQKEISLKIFPNPVKSEFTVRLPNYIQKDFRFEGMQISQQKFSYKKEAYLEVVDVNGRILCKHFLSENQDVIQFNAETWLKGIYLLRLISDNKQVAKTKVIKN
ncbi:MAG: T9SS type A sorting domain-containing protein, partial [Bacteroidales bacterium]